MTGRFRGTSLWVQTCCSRSCREGQVGTETSEPWAARPGVPVALAQSCAGKGASCERDRAGEGAPSSVGKIDGTQNALDLNHVRLSLNAAGHDLASSQLNGHGFSESVSVSTTNWPCISRHRSSDVRLQ